MPASKSTEETNTTKLKSVLLGALLLAPAVPQAALAQAPAAPAIAAPASGPAYMVTYIEAKHADKGKAAALLKSLAKASRVGDGNLRFDVLVRRDRANQFSIVDVWRDQAAAEANLAAAHTNTFRDALEAHEMAKHTLQYRNRLTPMSGSLYDQRLYRVPP